MENKKSFAEKVWNTLQDVNVNAQTEKKNGLTYLSWSWAWSVLMEYFPESNYEIHAEKVFADGTMEVGVTVTVKEGNEQISRYMWLPVIDYKNSAVKNPDSFLINKNKMRCLVKCIAMFGLGLYIFSGEDLPESERPKPKGYSDFEYEIRTAENMDDLKQIFAEAWRSLSPEEKAKIKDIYENKKADFELTESEQV